ncbi:solute carrier family 47 member 4 isoform X2 [Puntigrus tetrazona]|uniref:solute carrier family 47 member 4 isoform X2 n=1 Tax=Puntigrus tetrazona TaxID=1606681 RepID=UPI001C891CEC|nr:solute carrier family 47 member 4 isoform X2 [Puntigrus tetrazona]
MRHFGIADIREQEPSPSRRHPAERHRNSDAVQFALLGFACEHPASPSLSGAGPRGCQNCTAVCGCIFASNSGYVSVSAATVVSSEPGSAQASDVRICSCQCCQCDSELLSAVLVGFWSLKLHEKTWGGWSSEALQDWGSYMKLAIPSTLMTCFEWWIYEVGGFLAGMLSEVDLAAQHVVIMLAYINFMIPLGMQGAACVRVGNALGAGETAAAILTSKVSLISAAVIAIFQGFVLGSTKTVIGYIFTSDEAIAELVSQLLNIYCPLQFFNGILGVGMGILLGTGQQKIAAIANLFGYYCIGLPSSIVLMFTAKLQVAGFWLGLLIAVFLLAIFFTVAIFKLNWKKMTEEAIERTGKNANGAMTPSHRNSFYQVVLNAEFQNGNGYMVVSSQDQDEGLNHTVVHEGPNMTQAEEKAAVLLSTSQLVLRRGLTTLAALLTLAVGLAVYIIVPLPEVSYGAAANFTLDSNFTTAVPSSQ